MILPGRRMLGEGFEFDPSRIPAGMDVFQALAMMPADQRAAIAERMDEAFSSLGESMITQMAVGAVKAEYEALGMDAGKIQRDYILRTGGTMLLISLLGWCGDSMCGLFCFPNSGGRSPGYPKGCI